jgi:hypothetical protein
MNRAGIELSLKYIYIAACMAVLSSTAISQPFSYIYIQGDKETPFYVKREGQMEPRYGKNHCIIPELNAGPIHIEILFQQRVLPGQKFVIDVPENGYRGFLLTKQDKGFALYDLQKKDYLRPTE